MKIRLERILSVICAAILMICALSACLAEEGLPATPTDLAPAQEEGTVPAAATEPAEEPQDEIPEAPGEEAPTVGSVTAPVITLDYVQEEVNGIVTTVIDAAAGIIKYNGVDVTGVIENLLA